MEYNDSDMINPYRYNENVSIRPMLWTDIIEVDPTMQEKYVATKTIQERYRDVLFFLFFESAFSKFFQCFI